MMHRRTSVRFSFKTASTGALLLLLVAATAAGFAAHGIGKAVQRAATGRLDKAPSGAAASDAQVDAPTEGEAD